MSSQEKIRAAFRDAALGLMAWQDPPLVTPREYRRLELLPTGYVHRPRGKQEIPEYVEPFNVQADWEERS